MGWGSKVKCGAYSWLHLTVLMKVATWVELKCCHQNTINKNINSEVMNVLKKKVITVFHFLVFIFQTLLHCYHSVSFFDLSSIWSLLLPFQNKLFMSQTKKLEEFQRSSNRSSHFIGEKTDVQRDYINCQCHTAKTVKIKTQVCWFSAQFSFQMRCPYQFKNVETFDLIIQKSNLSTNF